MATKKRSGPGLYVALRDFADNVTGDVIELADDVAALLIRDGMVAPTDTEGGES